ncbi:hypothetical protein EJ07DRAFT_182039 [Lizonia empirigonia]|nr:hypothetical protein EJ07DRAFT_182039 [Lizonia empirigonia]
MRFSTIAAFATSLAVVSAVDLSQVPDCAVACLVAAIPGSGCSVSDTACQCTTGQAAITSSLDSCVPTSCSTEDAAKVAPALAGICSAAGYPISVSSSAAATSAPASSASSAAASVASSAVSSAASVASSAASAAASATGGSSTSPGSAQSTGGAAANAAGLGAVMLGVFVAAL